MKRVTFARYSLVVVVCIVFQIVVVGRFQLARIYPDITILGAVAAGLVGGPQRGAVIGFCIGLGFDPVLTTPFGFTALVLCLVGFGAGVAEETINAHSRAGLAVFCLACSAAGVVVHAVVGELFGLRTLENANLGRIIGIVAVVNGILAPVAIIAMEWAESETGTARASW